MLTLQTCIQPNANDVAAKVIDGEAILINITNGMYHSLDQVGGIVWSLIENGHRLEQIVEAVVGCYGVDRETVETDVLALAEALLAENLVMKSETEPPAMEPATADGEYKRPELQTFRDMSDLLALDPPMPGLQQMPSWEQAG